MPLASDLVNNFAAALKNAGISSPRLEARILVGHILGLSADEVLFSHQELIKAQEDEAKKLLGQRLAHQPLDKILGSKDFYKYRFKVSNDVLSPRPDTEVLVEKAIALAQADKIPSVLDLGTGSGCILLSILADLRNLKGVGVDKSAAALEIAAANAYQLGVNERAAFINASWFDENLPAQTGRFKLIVSNPPYIPSHDILELEQEVRDFDPISALDGGGDGLTHYRQIAQAAPQLLLPEGYILLEVGIHQARDVAALFISQGFRHLETLKDLGGIERCLVMQLSA